MKNLNKRFIKSIAGEVIYERGVGYYEDGMVKNILELGNVIKAEVEGSQSDRYKVKIIFSQDGIRCSCTCPYEGTCKHIVATLLALENKGKKRTIKEQVKWQDRLAELKKDELIKLLAPLVESDHDLKVMVLNKLGDKGKDTALDKYYEYWTKADELLGDFQRYGGGSDADEDTIYGNLEEIAKLFHRNKLPQAKKKEFIDNILDCYLGGNTRFDDFLIEIVFSVSRSKEDWLQIIERLKKDDDRYNRDLVMTIYRDYLNDKESYLFERKKELKYGLDYYELAKFYEVNGDKRKALAVAQEGVVKGEGRKIDLYEYLFKYFQEKGDYENCLKCLKEMFQEVCNLETYKRLITFSQDKANDAKWAVSFLRKQKALATLAEINLYEKRYDEVLRYIFSENNYYDFHLKEDFADKLKDKYPYEIINFYEKMVESCLRKVTAKAYRAAAGYIKKIKYIRTEILNEAESYKSYIAGLRQENAKRPTFLRTINGL
ncbi:MAG: SWIM zinc finger family protein [candidate division WOR-3 bacterium]|nr:SWIM zinc finger family protein [candidate division WOR-3 bacterium]